MSETRSDISASLKERSAVSLRAAAPRRTSAPDPSSAIARLQKAAKRATEEGDIKQAEKSTQAARDLERIGDDERFEGALRKLATP